MNDHAEQLTQARVDIAVHKAEIASLQRSLAEMKASFEKEMGEMRSAVESMSQAMQGMASTLAEARGGWKTLMLVGGAAGFISAVGVATATLHVYGYGEMTFGSVIAAAGANTTITVINIGTMRNCFLLLRNSQVTRTVTIKHDGATGPIVMKAGVDKVLSTFNAQVLFWINSLGHLVEI